MTEKRRRPGAWPVDEPVDLDAIHTRLDEDERGHTSEAARFEMVTKSIRAHLEEQPTERTVRTAARRWRDTVTSVEEEVARTHRRRAG